MTLPLARLRPPRLIRRLDALLASPWARVVVFVSGFVWAWLFVLAGAAWS